MNNVMAQATVALEAGILERTFGPLAHRLHRTQPPMVTVVAFHVV